MQRILFAALVFLLVPAGAFAAPAPASFMVGRSLIAASSSPGNAYAAGVSVVLTAPVAGDFSALGGSVITAAPVSGDDLLFGGSVSSRANVAGDLRAVGGSIDIEEPVGGDLAACGYDVYDSGRLGGNVFIVAANTTLANGAAGPVTLYGNNVSLAGDFGADVTVVASGRLSLAASTTIRGALSYQSPLPADIPASVRVTNGIHYTSASYLPDVGASRILALVSMGFFLFARILGALILAGLLAGLFPKLAEAIVRRSGILLTTLLGFAILVATPVLLIPLSLTFVGIGLALLLFILYALLALLAVIYAGILLGCLFARRVARRDTVLWHDGAVGMLILSLIAFVPFIGFLIALLLALFSAGALLQIFFHFAFPREENTPEML
ncbi:MAG: hypothetical protein B7X03_03405 [Parcubacteria group bacterium 21-58-10]|nr:MAG: hypothetical protein B7X03_03405 [Parcubacteria group bacterium 21-58-10]